MFARRSLMVALACALCGGAALAQEPEYTTIELEIDINAPAERSLGQSWRLLRYLVVAPGRL